MSSSKKTKDPTCGEGSWGISLLRAMHPTFGSPSSKWTPLWIQKIRRWIGRSGECSADLWYTWCRPLICTQNETFCWGRICDGKRYHVTSKGFKEVYFLKTHKTSRAEMPFLISSVLHYITDFARRQPNKEL